MAASTSPDPGRIFISYRREDSAFPAGWLYDRLCAHFGSEYVFKDVDSIDPGDDFLRVIEDAVGSCQVLLALIGDRWLDITNDTGNRRLDDPNDFVRLEIEAALRRDVRVIPILVGRALLPSREQLPDSLQGLIRRHAIELSPNRFEPDVARLVRTIDKTLALVGERPADTPAPVDQPSGPQGPPAGGRRNLSSDPEWVDATNAYWNKRWAEAVQRFEALEARYPGDDQVVERLKDARRQRDIDASSRAAAAAAAAGDWDAAVTALENLAGLDPNYPNVTARLEQARIGRRRTSLVDEMTALHKAGRWDGVVAAAQELARLDPGNADPGGIVSDAKAKIRDAELAERFAQALNLLDQGHWQQAADRFAAIEREQPGYREAAALHTTARRMQAEFDRAGRATTGTPPSPAPHAPEPGSTGIHTFSKPATNKPGSKRGPIWIAVAATLVVAVAIAVTAIVLSAQRTGPGSAKSPERLIPQNDFINTAQVGACFEVRSNQQVVEKACSEPGVLKVIKLAYTSNDCNDIGAGGNIRADNTGVVACWSKNG